MWIVRPEGMGEDLAPWRMFKDIGGDPRGGQTDAMRFAEAARKAEPVQPAALVTAPAGGFDGENRGVPPVQG